MQWLFVLVAFGCGLILPLQPGINAELRTHLESPFAAALVSFAVGVTSLAMVTATIGRPPAGALNRLAEVPWWAWTGGLIGAVAVTASVVLAPRLGATVLFGAVVTGQLFGSLVIDHFGLVGFVVNPVTWGRLLGVGLLLAGVIVVQLSTGRG